MVEKHRICFSCIRTLSKSLDKGILMSLIDGLYLDFGQFEPAVCE